MILSQTQINELLNQHIGTGYIFVITANNNVRIIEIHLARSDKWLTGDYKLVSDKLNELTAEIKQNDN